MSDEGRRAWQKKRKMCFQLLSHPCPHPNHNYGCNAARLVLPSSGQDPPAVAWYGQHGVHGDSLSLALEMSAVLAAAICPSTGYVQGMKCLPAVAHNGGAFF